MTAQRGAVCAVAAIAALFAFSQEAPAELTVRQYEYRRTAAIKRALASSLNNMAGALVEQYSLKPGFRVAAKDIRIGTADSRAFMDPGAPDGAKKTEEWQPRFINYSVTFRTTKGRTVKLFGTAGGRVSPHAHANSIFGTVNASITQLNNQPRLAYADLLAGERRWLRSVYPLKKRHPPPTVSRKTRNALRASFRDRLGSYERNHDFQPGKENDRWVWNGPERPTRLAKRPNGLKKMLSIVLPDISGFYLSHDTTRGRVWFDPNTGKGVLATVGAKSVPGHKYKAAFKYYQFNLTASELKLLGARK